MESLDVDSICEQNAILLFEVALATHHGDQLMKIIVAGGSGFLGSALLKKLKEAGHNVLLLTRNPERAKQSSPPSLQIQEWDARSSGPWTQHVDGADAVVNLCGASIAGGRWTRKRKELIASSRIDPTKILVEAMAQAKQKPSALVNASAVGYYGHVEYVDVAEDFPKGSDFLAETCNHWEREARAAEKLGVRVIMIRSGVVLAKHGGALPKLLFPFRLFIGEPLGSGRQWFPWIHLEDEISAILFALENSKLSGPVNLAAPDPVTMKQFCSALGRAMHRPSWAPVPSFVLRAILGEMADVLLTGQKVVPRKLLEAGYRFRFPKLDEALRDILKQLTH